MTDLAPFVTAWSTAFDETLADERVVVGGLVDRTLDITWTGYGRRATWLVDDARGLLEVILPVERSDYASATRSQGDTVIVAGWALGGPVVVADGIWTLAEARSIGPEAFARLTAARSRRSHLP